MGNIAQVVLVAAKQSPSATNPTHVELGTIIKAVFVELWVLGASNSSINSVMTCVEKAQADTFMDFSQSQDLNAYVNKKNILETHQGILGNDNTNPVPFFRGWIKIPKGKQRFGAGDSLFINIASILDDVTFCGVTIFKAYN